MLTREIRPVEDESFDLACRFINALVAAVQRYGVSSSTMESMLGQVARALGVRGQFQATPTQVQSILWKPGEDRQRLHVAVSSTGNYDLNRLAQVSELVEQVKSGDVSPEVGLDRLRTIDDTPREYGPWMNAAAYAVCGAGFGVILGLSWLDVLLGGLLGVVSFGIAGLIGNSPGLSTALELIAAATAAALAGLLCLVVPGSNALAVAVCAVIYFVPGFGLTLGTSELMAGNTLSGLLGFTRAAVTSGKLFVGVLIGNALVRGLVPHTVPNVHSGVPHVWTWLSAPALVVGLAVLFRVRRKELVWPLLGGILVWAGVQAGSGFGFWQGTFIGAFLLMTGSRLFSRLSGLPSTIILLPAVMVLVPGLAALESLYSAQTQGPVEGIRSTYRVIVLIAAILGGTLLGEAVWSIRGIAVSAVTSKRERRGPASGP